jgi:hypothetical protein
LASAKSVERRILPVSAMSSSAASSAISRSNAKRRSRAFRARHQRSKKNRLNAHTPRSAKNAAADVLADIAAFESFSFDTNAAKSASERPA